MARRISHVGIAVENLQETLKFFEDIFTLKPTKTTETPKMKAAFIFVGNEEIELIEPTDPNHLISKFIKTRGEGVHHISIQVDNLEKVVEAMKKKGIRLIDEKPRIGLHGTKIVFLDPLSTKGILIELCEEEG